MTPLWLVIRHPQPGFPSPTQSAGALGWLGNITDTRREGCDLQRHILLSKHKVYYHLWKASPVG